MADPITTAIGGKAVEAATGWGLNKALEWAKNKWRGGPLTIERIKKTTTILFVDDEDRSERLQAIRNAGWNVNQVQDVVDYYSNEICQADIIFMDYSGVGKQLSEEQGVGLLKSIKQRHSEKFLIFYSGQAGFMQGPEVFKIADDWIAKHADLSEYLDHIEAAAKVIHEKKRQ